MPRRYPVPGVGFERKAARPVTQDLAESGFVLPEPGGYAIVVPNGQSTRFPAMPGEQSAGPAGAVPEGGRQQPNTTPSLTSSRISVSV